MSASESRQIELARVICITLMINAHWTPLPDPMLLHSLSGQIFSLAHGTAEVVSKSSVAALSLVAGYLLFAGRAPTLGGSLRGRLRTVFIPLLVWNLVFIASVLLRCTVTDYTTAACEAGFWPPDHWPVTYVFGLFGNPADIHLAFLRDLIVSTILLVLATPVLRRAPLPSLLGLGLGCVFIGGTVVLVRPEILFCMAVGACIAFGGRGLDRISQANPALLIGLPCVLVFVLCDVFLPDPSHLVAHASTLSLRLGLALTFIWLARAVSRTAVSNALAPYARDIFFVYLSHYVVLNTFLLPALNRLGLRGELLFEGALIVALPVMCLVGLSACARPIDRLPPALQIMLRGRVAQDRPAGRP